MFIQIRRYKLESGTVEQVTKQAAEKFTPIIQKIPGFVDYLIMDSKDGKVASISIFKDKSGIEESRKKALEWNKQFASPQLPSPPEVIEGEILFEGSLDQKLFKAA